MAHILCVTGAERGLLHASCELARRLVAAGHRVSLLAPAAALPVVRAHGLDGAELGPAMARGAAPPAERGGGARWLRLAARRRAALDELGADDFAAELERSAPDLALIDCELHEAIVATRSAGIRVAQLCPFVSIWRRPGLPPPHVLALPGRGLRGSGTGIRLLWTVLRIRRAVRRVRAYARHAGCDRVSLLRHLALQRGFAWRREADFAQWLMPLTWRSLPALVLHAFELELPHRPRAGVHYVGPMVAGDRPTPVEHRLEEARLRALLPAAPWRDRQPGSGGDGGARWIYAAFGTHFTASPRLLRELIAAVEQRPWWHLVISLGGAEQESALGERDATLPPNVHLFPWVPQPDVLRRVDLAVVHGGSNTAEECVLAGAPMLVYCGGQTDMAGVASRVVFHGLGALGDAQRDRAPRIGERIEALMEDEDALGRIETMRSHCLRYAPERVLERTVEGLLAAADGAEGSQ
ncbi:MAG: glycosyltransferase [Acidobacteria bacterium]|nr:MAG: glycosyltransferase [Acidobacteriota bacterium]